MPYQKKIVFFGTSSFAKEVLQFLLQKKYPVVAVITQKEIKKNNRYQPSEVKSAWEKMEGDIPLFEPEKCGDTTFQKSLKELQADIFLVVAYGKILPKSLLDIPKLAPINIHASLLPKYRGAAPIQRALMAGEKETGISIIKMVEACDAGEIIRSGKILISEEEVFTEVEKKLMDLSKDLIEKVLLDFTTGNISYTPQDPRHISFAPKITKEECQIDWNKEASLLHNHIRALAYRPGAWSFIQIGTEKKRLKIFRSKVTTFQDQVGKISVQAGSLIVACKKNSLELLEVQLEGKNRMSGQEFLHGVRHLTLFLS